MIGTLSFGFRVSGFGDGRLGCEGVKSLGLLVVFGCGID